MQQQVTKGLPPTDGKLVGRRILAAFTIVHG